MKMSVGLTGSGIACSWAEWSSIVQASAYALQRPCSTREGIRHGPKFIANGQISQAKFAIAQVKDRLAKTWTRHQRENTNYARTLATTLIKRERPSKKQTNKQVTGYPVSRWQMSERTGRGKDVCRFTALMLPRSRHPRTDETRIRLRTPRQKNNVTRQWREN